MNTYTVSYAYQIDDGWHYGEMKVDGDSFAEAEVQMLDYLEEIFATYTITTIEKEG